MKRMAVIFVTLMAASVIVVAQQRGGPPPPPPPLEPGASQADVDKALIAAPPNLKNQATVIKWKPADWSYDTLRKGTNTLVCVDNSGLPGQAPFSVECTQRGNLPRMAQNMKIETDPDRAKRQAMVDAMEKDGTRIKPEFGSVWYHLRGQDQATANSHVTIAVPGATGATMGLPENGRGGGVWVMNPGTSTAHLMVPGE